MTMLDDTERYNLIDCIDKELDAATCWRLLKDSDIKAWTKEQKIKVTKFCTTIFGNLDVVSTIAAKIAKKKEAEDSYNNVMQNATKTTLIKDTAAVKN